MKSFKFSIVVRPLPKADRGSKRVFSRKMNDEASTTNIISTRSTIKVSPWN